MPYITHISLDANSLIRSEKNRHERERVVTDIIKNNEFSLKDSSNPGPFTLDISIASNKVIVNIAGDSGGNSSVEISLAPLRRVIKDYSIICESYFDAIKTADPRKVEAIDMGRRGVHNEGAEILQEQTNNLFSTDFETARKLFSLIYLLQEK